MKRFSAEGCLESGLPTFLMECDDLDTVIDELFLEGFFVLVGREKEGLLLRLVRAEEPSSGAAVAFSPDARENTIRKALERSGGWYALRIESDGKAIVLARHGGLDFSGNALHGFESAERGEFIEAVEFFEKSCRENPSGEIFYQAGLACLRMEEREKAHDFFARALEHEPAHSRALFYQAEYYRARSEYNMAGYFFSRALHYFPLFPQALIESAAISLLLNDDEKGLELLGKYVSVAGMDPAARETLKRFSQALGESEEELENKLSEYRLPPESLQPLFHLYMVLTAGAHEYGTWIASGLARDWEKERHRLFAMMIDTFTSTLSCTDPTRANDVVRSCHAIIERDDEADDKENECVDSARARFFLEVFMERRAFVDSGCLSGIANSLHEIARARPENEEIGVCYLNFLLNNYEWQLRHEKDGGREAIDELERLGRHLEACLEQDRRREAEKREDTVSRGSAGINKSMLDSSGYSLKLLTVFITRSLPLVEALANGGRRRDALELLKRTFDLLCRGKQNSYTRTIFRRLVLALAGWAGEYPWLLEGSRGTLERIIDSLCNGKDGISGGERTILEAAREIISLGLKVPERLLDEIKFMESIEPMGALLIDEMRMLVIPESLEGTLVVNGAIEEEPVFLNGVAVGPAPVRIPGLEAGSYMVRCGEAMRRVRVEPRSILGIQFSLSSSELGTPLELFVLEEETRRMKELRDMEPSYPGVGELGDIEIEGDEARLILFFNLCPERLRSLLGLLEKLECARGGRKILDISELTYISSAALLAIASFMARVSPGTFFIRGGEKALETAGKMFLVVNKKLLEILLGKQK